MPPILILQSVIYSKYPPSRKSVYRESAALWDGCNVKRFGQYISVETVNEDEDPLIDFEAIHYMSIRKHLQTLYYQYKLKRKIAEKFEEWKQTEIYSHGYYKKLDEFQQEITRFVDTLNDDELGVSRQEIQDEQEGAD